VNFRLSHFVTALFVFASMALLLCSCGSKEERRGKANPQADVAANPDSLAHDTSHSGKLSISKVTFFIENSGSMLGYVKKANHYISSLVSLSYSPEFDNANKEFYFINGTSSKNKNSQVQLSFIGTDADVLKSHLNPDSFRKYGDPRYSDLTRMFEKALEYTSETAISVLVSDCIYDVGEESNPLMALKVEIEKTKKVFRDRLVTDDIQTILIKAESDFSGNYYFSSRKGSVVLNQKRPFYILIFGSSKLLNKYFTEDVLSKRVSGYISMVRFMKIDGVKIPYQVTSQNKRGSFRFDHSDKNKLTEVAKDRNRQDFQFSIAVDYSSLPFPDDYYKNPENYTVSLSEYKIVDIQNSSGTMPEVQFTPSHLIIVRTSSNPFGNLEVSLDYKTPIWVEETNIDDDSTITGDTTHTFSFKYLTDAIAEAYKYHNKQQHLTTFNIQISN
jgi:hypothetical protein